MNLEGFENIHVELKYCERCGGLWMRRVNSGDVFCAGCALEMADMATPKRKRSRARLPVNVVDLKAECDDAPACSADVVRGEA